jgi:hypothetical protein
MVEQRQDEKSKAILVQPVANLGSPVAVVTDFLSTPFNYKRYLD